MGYTLTSKSQVTLPKQIRDHLKVAPGDAIEFRIVADGSVRVLPATPYSAAGASDAKLAKYRKLQGIGGHAGGSTDDLMKLLRGYDDDAGDPGFAAPAPAAPANARRSRR